MTTTGLIKYIIAAVGNIVKGTININHKIIIEVFIKVYFKGIARRNVIFIKS
jgi:hypothetical protein